MERSESIVKLAGALSKVQAEMPHVPMNASNPFFKSKYADLGSVISTARPLLSKNGLAVTQLPYSGDGQIGVETVLMHESGEYISSKMSIISPMKAQEAGSIITYLRRYSYAAVLGMYADEDNDGNESGEKKSAKNDTGNNQVSAALVVAADWAKVPPHADQLIAVLGISKMTMGEATKLYNIYRPWRESGLAPADAAAKVHAGEIYVKAA